MAAPELLMQLLRSPGPSGHESAPARVWREYCASFATEVGGDRVGSSFARVAGTARGLTVAVVGHIDEIGLHVSHIEDGGLRTECPGPVADDECPGRVAFCPWPPISVTPCRKP